MFGWTLLTRAVNVWRRTTPCAKLRRVCARRKTRSQSRPTSPHATEDDDYVTRVRLSPGSKDRV